MGIQEHREDTASTDISYGEAKSPVHNVADARQEAVQQLTPLEIQSSHTSFTPEVTMRQVAPLVLVLTGASFLNTISAQAVVIILPDMARTLNIPETRQQWIISAYALTSGAFLLLAGKLADVYGKRLLFILGCFFLTATTLGAAFSRNEICMYIMRALQGVGSAFTVPTAMGIIGYTIPPGRVKNYSFAFYSGGAPTGQVLGNLIGGFIAQWAKWDVVFLVIASAAFIIAVSGIFVVPKEKSKNEQPQEEARASGIDWLGAGLFTSGALLLLLSLSEGVSKSWNTPFVIALIILSVLLLILFGFWQHRLERLGQEPLLRISVFNNSRFSCAMAVVFMLSVGFTNFLIYSTYFWQDYQMLSPLQTTIRYIPLGVVGVLATISSGFLMARVRGDYIIMFGLVSGAIANLLFAVPIPPSTNYFAYRFPAMCLAALSADIVYPITGLFTTQALPREDQAIGGALFQTVGGLARSISLPITSTIQTQVQNHLSHNGASQQWAFLEGIRAVEWFCTACMIISVLIVLCGLRNIGKVGLLKKLGNVSSAAKENNDQV